MNLIIAANWKMHKNAAETAAFCHELCRKENSFTGADVLICPPHSALWAAAEALQGSLVKLGAQNMHWAEKGAYTGEVAASMLLEYQVEYVLIGHSERRHLFGETNEQIAKKVQAALLSGLKPILCVGETKAQRQAGVTEKVLQEQLSSALGGLNFSKTDDLVIAYEPVWAIGTGQAATADDAQKAANFIHQAVREAAGESLSARLRVQYGGSVNAENIGSFMALPALSGALVGGAGLEADSFLNLIAAARKAVLS